MIAATAQFERLQSGIQAALLLVQQTVEQEDRGFQFLLRDLQHGRIRYGGNGFHVAARQELPLLDGAVGGRVQIQTGNDLSGHPALLSQLMQRVLHIDVQGTRQFVGEIPARRTIDECLGGGQQRAEAREPDVCLRPQSLVVKAGDFAQGIVSAAMGVAGEVVQRFEFAEDGDIDRGAEGLLEFVEGGDLAAQQQRAQFIGAEREGPHNVIVPDYSRSSCSEL